MELISTSAPLSRKTSKGFVFFISFLLLLVSASQGFAQLAYPQLVSTGNPAQDQTAYQAALAQYDQQKQQIAAGRMMGSKNLSQPGKQNGVPKGEVNQNALAAMRTPAESCIIPRDASWIKLPAGDDNSSPAIPLGFNFDLYGQTYTQAYINNNGNLSFTGPVPEFAPLGFPYNVAMVAPFWADVDTRSCGGVYYKLEATRLIVSWEEVGFYSAQCGTRNTFQVIIGTTNDPLIGFGQNVKFFYGNMQWFQGSAAAAPATVGVNKGNSENYVQVGRFGILNSTAYDGGLGATDGLDYLDYQCFSFNVSSAENQPPSLSGFPTGNTVSLGCGESATYTIQSLPPEVNQTVTTTVNTNGMCGVTTTITNGAVSTVNITVTGTTCNAGTNTITFTSTDNANPALTTTSTLTVVVGFATPTITSPSSVICPGGNVVLTAPAGYTYQWRLNGTPIVGAVAQTYGATAAGSYTVAVTNGICTVVSASKDITVSTTPTPTITPSGSVGICLGGSVVLTSSPGVSYVWKRGTTQVGTSQTYAATAAGSYTVTVTDANGCSATSAATTTTLNALPAAPTVMAVTVCEGTAATLNVTNVTAGLSYSWSAGGTTFATGSSVSVTPSSTTMYTVTATNTTTGCVRSTNVTVTVNKAPVITTCPSNITVNNTTGQCGAIVTYPAAVVTGSPAPTVGYSTPSGSFFPVGTTTVTVTAQNLCGTITCTFTVTVVDVQAPVITCPATLVVSADAGLCGAFITTTGGGGGGGINNRAAFAGAEEPSRPEGIKLKAGKKAAVFTQGGTGIVNARTVAANLLTPTVTENCTYTTTAVRSDGKTMSELFPVGNTTITWRATDAAGNFAECTQTITVTDDEAPVITSCPDNKTLTSCTQTIPSYTASIVASDNCTSAGSIVFTQSPAAGSVIAEGATVTVTLTATDAKGNSSNCNFTVTRTASTTPTITPSGSVGICLGGSVVLTSSPGVSYVWKRGTTQVGTSQTYAATAAGSYTVTVTDANGCSATSAATTTTLNALPAAPTVMAVTVCEGTAATLNVTNVTAGLSYSWSAGGTTFATGSSVSVTPSSTTMYTVTATNTTTGCVRSTNVTVTVNKAPVITTCPSNITVNNTTGQCGAIVTYPAAVVTGSPAPTVGYSTPSGSFFPVGTTTVTVTAQNLCGTITCTFTVTVVDVQAPVITCPATLVVSADAGLCGAFITTTGGGGGGGINNRAAFAGAEEPSRPEGIKLKAGKKAAVFTQGGTGIVNARTVAANLLTPTVTENCTYTTTAVRSDGKTMSELFPVGNTTITWRATDAAGNFAECTQTITVTDDEAPTLSCPTDITTVVDAASCGAVVNYTVGYTDNCSATLAQTAGLPSGSQFPVGTTTNTFIATDASGNTSTCSFTVTVNDTQAPVLVGVPAAATVECDALPAPANVTATDNCAFSGAVSYNEVRANGACPSNYTLTRTWSTTDASGNTTTASQVITVQDTKAPALTVPANISVNNDANVCGAAVSFAATATDNCGAVNIAYSKQPGSVFAVGTTTVTVTATDACGNSTVRNFTVTVADVQKPVISGMPANITVNALANNCLQMVRWDRPAASDNCGVQSFVPNDPIYASCAALFPVGTTTVTYTATDIHGNITTTSFTVTVEDKQAPTITGCPANITQSATAGKCNKKVLWNPPVASDNCPGVSLSASHLPGQFYPVGVTTVTYTATDASGNVSTCSFTITITDNEAPVITSCPAAVTAYTNAGCTATGVALGLATATDNCGAVTITNNAPAAFPLGNTTVTWTATDAAGNTTTCTQVVTVRDNVAPVITVCAPAKSVFTNAGCTATGVVLGTPTGTDNCGTVTFSNNAPAVFPLGNTTVTWTATDAAGNTTTCTQVVTVVDNVKPTITCPPTQTLNLSAGCAGTLPDYRSLATVADNCSDASAITITQSPAIGSAVSGVGVTQITLTATDAAGNSQSCTFNVERKDVTPPSITCVEPITVANDANTCGAVVSYAAPTAITFSQSFTQGQTSPHCNEWKSFQAQLLANLNYAKLTIKGSADPVGVSLTNPALVAQIAAALRTGTPTQITDGGRTWSVGSCGWDGSAPAIELTASSSICNCGTGYTVRPCIDVAWGNPNWGGVGTQTCSAPSQVLTVIFELAGGGAGITATDDCGGPVTITQTAGLPSGAVFPVGTTVNTFEATDASGNKSQCSFTVTVKDTQVPVIACPQDINVIATSAAGASVSYATPAGTDNCAGAVTTLTSGLPSGATFPIGTTTVTHKVTDAAGLTAECSFTVTVIGVPPVVVCPANITVINETDQCGAVVTFEATETTAIPASTITYSIAPGSFFPVGTTTVTVTATNAVGTSTCSFTVTVNDTQAPVLVDVPENITVECDAVPKAAVVTATDNCTAGAVTYAEVRTNGNSASNYILTRTWSVSDAAGNTTTASQTITVQDTQAPVLTEAPANETVECDAVTVAAVLTATDNCDGAPVVIYNEVRTDGYCPSNYTLTRTWTATDASGNVSSKTQVVTVQDSKAPVITTPAGFLDRTIECSDAAAIAAAEALVPTATDNCGTPAMLLISDEKTAACGTTYTQMKTWKFVDACGNESGWFVQTIRVQDTQAPVLSAPANIAVNNDHGVCGAVVNFTATASDNCGSMWVSYSHESGSVFPVGTTTVTVTAADACENTTVKTFTITVTDNEVPTITAPAAIAQAVDAGKCFATVNLGNAVTADNCAVQSVTNNAPVTYPVGTTVVTWTVTDVNGNVSTATQTVTITDNEAPVVTCGAAVTKAADAGKCFTTVTLTAPAASDNCGIASVTNDAPATFTVGTTVVTWTTKDVAGNTTTCTQNVTVTDTQKPTISCSANVTKAADAGKCTATVVLATPVTADNCGIASVTNNAPATYPVGVTVVTWTVTDVNGNSQTATQTVTVTDNQLPTITCPANITKAADAGKCNTTVTIAVPASADNCGVASVKNSINNTANASGTYPVGTTTILWVVTDVNGNTSTCTQTVTVTDTEKPALNVPAAISACDNGSNSKTLVLGATDNCGVQTVAYTISGATTGSGSGVSVTKNFALGTSTITWTVTDVNGNVNTGSTTVTITAIPPATITVTSPSANCNTITLTANSSQGGANTYQWYYGGNLVATTQTLSLGDASAGGEYSVYVTNAGGCRSAAPATYTYNKAAAAPNYTIVGINKVSLGDNNTVQNGSVGVTSASGSASFGAKDTVASVGAFVRASSITAGSGSYIPTKIYSAAPYTMPAMQTYTGTYPTTNYTVAAGTTVSLSSNYNTLYISKNSTVTLTGTTFKTVTVEDGAKVTFTSTTLNMDKLYVGDNSAAGVAKLVFANNTAVRVSTSVEVDEKAVVNSEGNKVTFYLGDAPCSTEKFIVQSGAQVYASVYVPGGNIKVMNTCTGTATVTTPGSCSITNNNYVITYNGYVQNSNGTYTFNFNVKNNWKFDVSHIAFELCAGTSAVSPTSSYSSAYSYSIENGTNNPFRSIKFEAKSSGFNNGKSDNFSYTVTAAQFACMTTIRVQAKAATNLGNATFNREGCGSTVIAPVACPTTYMTGLFVAKEVVSDKQVVWNGFNCGDGVSTTDNVKPVITCPAAVSTCKESDGTYSVAAATATDNSGAAPTITYATTGATVRSGTGGDASGSFNVGVTTITYTATDGSGNTSTCTATVTINALPTAVITATNTSNGVNLTGSASGGTAASYQWYNEAGTLISTNQVLSLQNPVSTSSLFAPTGAAKNFNVFVRNNVTAVGGDTHGPVAMGGDMVLSGNTVFVMNNSGTYPTNTANHADNYGMVIGGKMVFTSGNMSYVNRGLLRLADASSARLWYTDNNNAATNLKVTKPGSNFNANPALQLQRQQPNGTATTSNGLNFNTAFSNLSSYGSIIDSWHGVSSSLLNKITIPSGSNPKITLAANKINYINLSMSQLSNLNSQGSITFNNKPTASQVVVFNIDISGTYNWTAPNMAGLSESDGAYIIWNFNGTGCTGSTLNINGSNPVFGTIFAPESNINDNNANNINGQIIGQSLKIATGEIHYYPFKSTLQAPGGCVETSTDTYYLHVTTTTGCRSASPAGYNNTYNTRTVSNANGEPKGAVANTTAQTVAPEAAANPGISAYPNPSRGQFTLQLRGFAEGDVIVTIVDGFGKVVLTKEVPMGARTQYASLQVDHLPAGSYRIRASNGKQVQTTQVVIAR